MRAALWQCVTSITSISRVCARVADWFRSEETEHARFARPLRVVEEAEFTAADKAAHCRSLVKASQRQPSELTPRIHDVDQDPRAPGPRVNEVARRENAFNVVPAPCRLVWQGPKVPQLDRDLYLTTSARENSTPASRAHAPACRLPRIFQRERDLADLRYLRARYYNPATGTFNRLDPFFGNLRDPLSLHRYLYTHGDPVNGLDPTGMLTMASTLSAIKISIVVGAIGGATYGYILNGWQGALTYGAAGAVAAPIGTVAILWGGWALSIFLPISEATGIFLVGSLAAEISAKHALYAWANAQTEQEKRAAAFALTLTGIGWAVGATAYIRSQYVSHQQMRQQGMYSELPEMYMQARNNIDMRPCPSTATNAAGHPRDAIWYFRELYHRYPEMFSTDNVNRIYGRYVAPGTTLPPGARINPRVPVVDETWVQYNRTHRSWMGASLEHHHIDQGPIATAIPEPVHDAWSAALGRNRCSGDCFRY